MAQVRLFLYRLSSISSNVPTFVILFVFLFFSVNHCFPHAYILRLLEWLTPQTRSLIYSTFWIIVDEQKLVPPPPMPSWTHDLFNKLQALIQRSTTSLPHLLNVYSECCLHPLLLYPFLPPQWGVQTTFNVFSYHTLHHVFHQPCNWDLPS